MTTAAIETFTLAVACERAGVGGVVSRAGIDYQVGRTGGVFTLRDHDVYRSITDFVEDGWSVVGSAAKTVREFFNELAPGTHVVRPRSVDVYVWSGISQPATQAPVLFRRDYGTSLTLDASLDEPSDWVVCTNEADEPIVEGILVQRTMRDVIRHDERHRVQNEEIVKLRADWRRLNDFLNEYADEQRMCPDYERRLDGWNESFDLLKLEGRQRDYTARVEVNVTYYVDVEVRASSEDAAREAIDDMYGSDMIEADCGWNGYGEINHSVSRISGS